MGLSISCGLMAIVLGFIFSVIEPSFSPLTDLLYSGIFYGGILLIIVGLAMYPSVKRTNAMVRSIIEIAKVRKEVTFSEISQETGHDIEIVQQVITHYLVGGFLFGYIEGDLFVRDTAGRRRIVSSERMGLESIMDD